MDKDRQIRFLYPPLVLVGFWLLAVKLDPTVTLASFLPAIVTQGNITVGELAAILAGGGVVVLVAGFLIGVVSVVFLRVLFWCAGCSTYEVVWSASALKRVAAIVGVKEARQKDACS